MTTILKKSGAPLAFLVLLITLILAPNQAMASETSNCCNDIDRARTLVVKNDQNQVIQGINLLIGLKKYVNSKERLTNADKERLVNSVFNLTKALDPSIDPSLKAELREDIQYDDTLGEFIKPFYESFIEAFNEGLK